MKKIKLIIVITLSFVLSGCWNYRELNDLSITTGLSFDIKDNNYIVSYMTVNPSKDESESNSSENSTTIYKGEGDSISSAYNNLNSKNPKIPYIGHLDVVIISEDLARKGVMDTIDFLMRMPESRKQFYIILSKGTDATSILETLAPLESFSSENISKSIISSHINHSAIFVEQYNNFVSNLLDEGKSPILSGVEIDNYIDDQKSSQNSKIKIDTIGIFKDDTLLGWANEEQTTGIKILNNNAESVLLESTCDNKKMASTLNNIKSNMKITYNDKYPKINVDIYADGALTQINCSKDLSDKEIINELETEFENKLKKIIDNSISLVQKKYKTDIFGYGNYIYKNYYKKWNTIKDIWDEEVFPQLDIEVSTNINLESTGPFNQVLMEVKQ